MSQEELNNLRILFIVKNVLENIDVNIIINDFVSQNILRNHFFMIICIFSLIDDR